MSAMYNIVQKWQVVKTVPVPSITFDHFSITSLVDPGRTWKVEEKQWIIGEDFPLVSQIPTDSPAKAVGDAPQAPNLSPKWLGNEMAIL